MNFTTNKMANFTFDLCYDVATNKDNFVLNILFSFVNKCKVHSFYQITNNTLYSPTYAPSSINFAFIALCKTQNTCISTATLPI